MSTSELNKTYFKIWSKTNFRICFFTNHFSSQERCDKLHLKFCIMLYDTKYNLQTSIKFFQTVIFKDYFYKTTIAEHGLISRNITKH